MSRQGGAVLVNTVRGEVAPSDLGYTLMHEHVAVSSAGVQQAYPEFIRRDEVMEAGTEALSAARAEGVRTIIDHTTLDLGRDIRLLAEISARTDVNIVAATGMWRDIPRVFWAASPNDIAPLFIREITEGIEGTEIKAGFIKVANDVGGVTPEGEIMLRAAARAHRATGVPISTHTWAPERVGLEQIEIFEDEGVDLNRVYIGHCNDTTDMSYLTKLVEKGVWIGMDRFPGGVTPATPGNLWERRSDTVLALIQAGHGGRVMLSHDWSVPAAAPTIRLRRRREEFNPDGYLFLTRNVFPRLERAGVDPRQLVNIMVENPRRFFDPAST